MPVYAIDERLIFPHPGEADPSGLLGIGGDLSVDRLLLAYANGIFPWYNEDDPVMWWSPDPRYLILPDKFKVSKSLSQVIRNTDYTISFDKHFAAVLEACSQVPRPGQDGTWITKAMKKAYMNLHKAGFAHSVEVYHNDKLSGGLYGVSLGRAFFGESMFFRVSNASKIALYYLVERLRKWDYHFIDSQVETSHMISLGAKPFSRNVFLNKLNEALKYPTKRGMW